MMPDEFAKAYDTLAGAGGGGGESEAPPPPAVESTPEPASAAPETPSAEPAQESGRQRDGKGRFAKGEGKSAPPERAPAPPAPADQGGAPLASPPVAPPGAPPALPEIKAPRDWKIAAREQWPKLPREVQEEAFRNSLEIRKTIDEAAGLRKNYETYTKATAPYEAMIRAEGMEPTQAVGLLLQREQALRTAPMQTRAAIIAHGIRSFLGTDEQAIKLLADALDGQPQQNGAQQHGPIDPRQLIAQAKREFAQEFAQQHNESVGRAAQGEIESFAASHEFMDDPDPETGLTVGEDMANLMAAQAEKGKILSPEDAYKLATRRHSEVSKTLAQRDAAKAAATRAAQAQAGRTAAAGLKNEPAGVQVHRAKNDTQAAAEAYDQLANQRV